MSQDASYGIWHKMDASVERLAVQRRGCRRIGSSMLHQGLGGVPVRCNGLLDGAVGDVRCYHPFTRTKSSAFPFLNTTIQGLVRMKLTSALFRPELE